MKKSVGLISLSSPVKDITVAVSQEANLCVTAEHQEEKPEVTMIASISVNKTNMNETTASQKADKKELKNKCIMK